MSLLRLPCLPPAPRRAPLYPLVALPRVFLPPVLRLRYLQVPPLNRPRSALALQARVCRYLQVLLYLRLLLVRASQRLLLHRPRVNRHLFQLPQLVSQPVSALPQHLRVSQLPLLLLAFQLLVRLRAQVRQFQLHLPLKVQAYPPLQPPNLHLYQLVLHQHRNLPRRVFLLHQLPKARVFLHPRLVRVLQFLRVVLRSQHQPRSLQARLVKVHLQVFRLVPHLRVLVYLLLPRRHLSLQALLSV